MGRFFVVMWAIWLYLNEFVFKWRTAATEGLSREMRFSCHVGSGRGKWLG